VSRLYVVGLTIPSGNVVAEIADPTSVLTPVESTAKSVITASPRLLKVTLTGTISPLPGIMPFDELLLVQTVYAI
jgi:hypothetical protein